MEMTGQVEGKVYLPDDETCVVPVALVKLACKVLDHAKCRECRYYTAEARHCENWGIYTEPYGYCYRAERGCANENSL